MSRTLLQTYGLKFHPFRPDVPIEALQVTPTLDAFLRRVELSIADGGYVMITGEPGTGKSVALRLLKKRLDDISDVVVGIIEHHQSLNLRLRSRSRRPLLRALAGTQPLRWLQGSRKKSGLSTSRRRAADRCSSSTKARRSSPASSANSVFSPARTSILVSCSASSSLATNACRNVFARRS